MGRERLSALGADRAIFCGLEAGCKFHEGADDFNVLALGQKDDAFTHRQFRILQGEFHQPAVMPELGLGNKTDTGA